MSDSHTVVRRPPGTTPGPRAPARSVGQETDRNRRVAGEGKTILIGAFDNVLAHVSRPLMVARELRKMGFRVLFAGGGPYLELVKQEGFETLPLIHLDMQTLIRALRRLFLGVGLWSEEYLERCVQDELELYREVQPDLILHDTRPSMAISARLAGIPCVSITNAYLTLYGTVPFRVLPPHLHPFLEPLRRYLVLRPHNRVRRKYGLPRTRPRAMMYDADMVLLSDIPEYAPTRNLPDNYHYVGPLTWEPQMDWPAELDELASDRPVIYFTLGSTGLPAIFHGVIEQLRDADYQVLITTGWQMDPAALGPLPDNFYATSYLPGNGVMQRSDLVICQNGSGTTYQALSAGIPIVGIPTHGEQRQNASLMKRQGVGVTVGLQELQDIKPSIERILTTPSFKENAVRLQETLSGYDGPRTSARLIHEYIGQG